MGSVGLRAAILGGSGYVGGELLRLLLGHPNVEVIAITSRRRAGHRVDGVHPNLRGLTDAVFCAPDKLPGCDVLFLATPHRTAMHLVPELIGKAECLIDLSADFRLREPAMYQDYYRTVHPAPQLLETFVLGCPELFRKELSGADRISIPGCMAVAAILALYPLASTGLAASPVVIDGRIGSSGAGMDAARNSHPERNGAMRVFAPVLHRHEAEIAQALNLDVHMSATGVPLVRGAQVVCQVTLTADLSEPGLRKLYWQYYADEPFVRVLAARRGQYRLPEPKILYGSNYCDVGFSLAANGRRAVVVAAMDNLMKGAAGNSVHCLNIRMGWPERMGLEFPGLHPL